MPSEYQYPKVSSFWEPNIIACCSYKLPWLSKVCFLLFFVAMLWCQETAQRNNFTLLIQVKLFLQSLRSSLKTIGLSLSKSNKSSILFCLFCSVIERQKDTTLIIIFFFTLDTVSLTSHSTVWPGRKETQEYKNLSIHILFLVFLLNLFFSIRWGSKMVVLCCFSVTWWAHKLKDFTPALHCVSRY